VSHLLQETYNLFSCALEPRAAPQVSARHTTPPRPSPPTRAPRAAVVASHPSQARTPPGARQLYRRGCSASSSAAFNPSPLHLQSPCQAAAHVSARHTTAAAAANRARRRRHLSPILHPQILPAMATAEEGDPDFPPSLLLAPLLESLTDLSPAMTTAAEGDPPFSLLLRLLDLPDLLQAARGRGFHSSSLQINLSPEIRARFHLTGVRAIAWCLLIHAEASLSRPAFSHAPVSYSTTGAYVNPKSGRVQPPGWRCCGGWGPGTWPRSRRRGAGARRRWQRLRSCNGPKTRRTSPRGAPHTRTVPHGCV
jgi:hypothetical protein